MKKNIPCKKCGKLVNHVSRYCLEHRRPWREGYKMGFQIRESVLNVPEEELILELEKEASSPHMITIGRTPLLIRAANTIRKLSKNVSDKR